MEVERIIEQLKAPIADLDTLLHLLTPPLACLSLLPPRFNIYHVHPLPAAAFQVPRHMAMFQREILSHVGPTWEAVLAEQQLDSLLEQYLCPDLFSFNSPAAGDVSLLAYSTLMSLPFTDYSIRVLVRLSERYPIDRLFVAVFSHDAHDKKRMRQWEDCVRNHASVPARLANALQGHDVPAPLEHSSYFANVCKRTECAVAALTAPPREYEISALAYLLTKLVNIGMFPPVPPSSPREVSFFEVCLPQIRARLAKTTALAYASSWTSILREIPSTLNLQSVLICLFANLRADAGVSSSHSDRMVVKEESLFLLGFIKLPDSDDWWDVILATLLSRDWSEAHARIFVGWISQLENGERALEGLLDFVIDIWANPDHVKHSLINRHHYVTSLLLITTSYLPRSSSKLSLIAFSAPLISGVGEYIAHLDESVRRCGMLVAEIIAELGGKKLDFGDWDGAAVSKTWPRQMRELLKNRDVDIKHNPNPDIIDQTSLLAPPEPVENHMTQDSGYDSDDSLTGYISPPSSRSASPTPSELAEIEKEPTIGVGVTKVPRPVYLTQLGALIRPTGGMNSDEAKLASDLEMGMDCAEELIRKKRGYGSELEENAVNLVYGFVGAQNNYELEGFSSKRQAALTALVTCVPRISAPTIIEEFFKNQYSIDQRFAMLNALALGARELASLPVPQSSLQAPHIAFPSKILPLRLHQKYTEDSSSSSVLPRLLDDISRNALDRDIDSTIDKVPALVRERRLKVQSRPPLQPARSERPSMVTAPRTTTFTEVASQYFVGPMINRFWLFFRDEQTREERTLHLQGRHRYHGAGTGLVLNPLVLSHFLTTLAIVAHAARNSMEWLAVIAPQALEVALTLGTKPISDEDGGDSKDASVLSAALELALVVVDGCLEIDGGRSLGLDHTALLFGTGEWAGLVFSRLEKGLLVEGGGGAQEVKLKRAAAGVLLKVDSLTSRWRRSRSRPSTLPQTTTIAKNMSASAAVAPVSASASAPASKQDKPASKKAPTSKPKAKTTAAKKSTATKAKASKANPAHPTWKEIITECIVNAESPRTGVSRNAIKKYAEDQYKLSSAADVSHLNRAIVSGVESGIFVQPKGPSGCVKLAPKNRGDSSKENSKPVSKTSSKPAVKKAAPAKTAKATSTKAVSKPKTTTKAKAATTTKSTKATPAKKSTTTTTTKKTVAGKAKAPTTKKASSTAAKAKKAVVGKKPAATPKAKATTTKAAPKKAAASKPTSKPRSGAKRAT
ncbi:Telomere-reg-2 domain-containing protein [Mycena indigotica]|uniref:Histone H1 n=1 Tax=Mycena indigotica TaxID=2126181 RepID=A0A8H6VV74_9AGAR|nr:Telomere-reg-2 domain-containing protein [Mycena indigotica]KAF7295097.1 Telomere-reg-2 domain-containing protein [Mycena indigotica]